MRFFTSLKEGIQTVATTSWNITKKYVAPSFIAIGRTFTVAGSALFGMQHVVKYITQEDDHPASLYASIASIAISVIVFLPTRGIALFRFFSQLGEPSHATNQHPIELSRRGKVIAVGLQGISYSTLLFTAINSYQSALTLIDFTSQKGLKVDNHEGNLEYVTQVIAVSLSVCSILTYGIYSLKKANLNSSNAARTLDTMDIPRDRYLIATIACSILGTTSIPFTNYFSSSSALNKIVWVKDLPSSVKAGFAGFNAFSGTVFYLLTQPPAIYAAVSPHDKSITPTQRPCFEIPMKVILYPVGFLDFGTGALTNFNGIVQTANQMTGIDPYNPILIGSAVPFATTTSLLNFFFSVHGAIKDTVNHYHHQQQGHVILPADIEDPDLSDDETHDVEYGQTGKHSPRLFSTPPEEVKTPLLIDYLPDEREELACRK